MILGLTIFGVLTSVYPSALFSTRSADKPIIPVWVPGDEEPRAEQTEDDGNVAHHGRQPLDEEYT